MHCNDVSSTFVLNDMRGIILNLSLMEYTRLADNKKGRKQFLEYSSNSYLNGM